MKALWASMGSGALFAAGLAVAGMTKPEKVIGFLDVRRWDPSLMFVMGGAIAVHMTLLRLITKKKGAKPKYESRFHLPTRKDIDFRLVAGAAIFGIGWGLGGYCPGPGLVSVGAGMLPALVFIAAMALGMRLEGLTSKLFSGSGSSPGASGSAKKAAPDLGPVAAEPGPQG